MNPEKIAAIVMLVSVMLSAGLEINVEHLLAALKNYGLFARALLANFIIIPIFGVLLARAFRLDEYIAIGFVLMALAPGVPFLVRAAGRTPGGSLGFAAALAFVMPALSIVTIPLTARFIFAAGLIAPADGCGKYTLRPDRRYARRLPTRAAARRAADSQPCSEARGETTAPVHAPVFHRGRCAAGDSRPNTRKGRRFRLRLARHVGDRRPRTALGRHRMDSRRALGPVSAHAKHCHHASEHRNVRGRRDRDFPKDAGRSHRIDVLYHSVFDQHHLPGLLPPRRRAGDRSIESST